MKKGFIALLLLISTMLLVACSAQSDTKEAKQTERYGDEIKEKTKTSDNTIKANIDTDLPSGMLFEISAKSEDGTTLEKQTGEVGVLGGIKGTFENVKPNKYTLTYSTLPLEKQSKKVQEKIKEADKTFDGQFIKNGVLNKVETVTLPESDMELAEETEGNSDEYSEPAVPAEYTSALNQAEAYSESMYMSKAGIYDQLTSDHGGQFSAEAAQYAVDNLSADYNQNALEQAKEYQESMSMSPEDIRDQLTSEHGGQFTQSEADYAIQNLPK